MNARVGDGSKLLTEPLTKVEVIDWIPTRISRWTSGARLKETFVGWYLEVSEPPKVRLPNIPFDPNTHQLNSEIHKSGLTVLCPCRICPAETWNSILRAQG